MKCAVLFFTFLAVVFGAPEAPYPPSGWKPNGQQFSLPNQYGSPSQDYGPADAGTEAPTTTQEPESDSAANSSRFSRLPGRQSAQYNQATSQFFFINPDGSVQQLTIPSQQGTTQRRPNPDSEQVNVVQNNVPLGQLVQLPVSNKQLGQLVRLPVNNSPLRTPQRSANLALVTGVQSAQANSRFVVRPIQPETQQQQQTVSSQSQQFFALTSDLRLQPVQQKTEQPQEAVSQTQPNSAIVLTPEGKFERLQLRPIQTPQPVNAAQREENGQYHLLLPSGKVQRVQYANQLSPDNRLTSNVEYNEVQPITGPVYTYGSPLVRVV